MASSLWGDAWEGSTPSPQTGEPNTGHGPSSQTPSSGLSALGEVAWLGYTMGLSQTHHRCRNSQCFLSFWSQHKLSAFQPLSYTLFGPRSPDKLNNFLKLLSLSGSAASASLYFYPLMVMIDTAMTHMRKGSNS